MICYLSSFTCFINYLPVCQTNNKLLKLEVQTKYRHTFKVNKLFAGKARFFLILTEILILQNSVRNINYKMSANIKTTVIDFSATATRNSKVRNLLYFAFIRIIF